MTLERFESQEEMSRGGMYVCMYVFMCVCVWVYGGGEVHVTLERFESQEEMSRGGMYVCVYVCVCVCVYEGM